MTSVEAVRRRQRISLVLTAITLGIVVFAGVYQFAVVNPKLDQNTQDVQAQADRNGMLVAQIDQSRYDAIVATCRETNKRHDKVIATLKEIGQQVIDKHPRQAAEVERRIEQNTVLIDALVPTYRCKHRADRLTN